jgi:16S rRNA (cytidine1402-2'-O)-methyltransferase
MLETFRPPIAVCRELTKLHEEVLWIFTKEDIENLTVKGEFCLVVDNTGHADLADTDFAVSMLRSRGFSSKDIAVLLKSIGISFKIKYNSKY